MQRKTEQKSPRRDRQHFWGDFTLVNWDGHPWFAAAVLGRTDVDRERPLTCPGCPGHAGVPSEGLTKASRLLQPPQQPSPQTRLREGGSRQRGQSLKTRSGQAERPPGHLGFRAPSKESASCPSHLPAPQPHPHPCACPRTFTSSPCSFLPLPATLGAPICAFCFPVTSGWAEGHLGACCLSFPP